MTYIERTMPYRDTPRQGRLIGSNARPAARKAHDRASTRFKEPGQAKGVHTAQKNPVIDPLDVLKVILAGTVVTLHERFTVVPDARVYIDKGQFVAVQPASAAAPAGFTGVAVTKTGGTMYPGLIELHNHLAYNVLPLWDVPKKFTNRGQWARHPDYQRLVTGPMQVVAATPELLH